jgi:membrane protein DedA with SNARE-associated domain
METTPRSIALGGGAMSPEIEPLNRVQRATARRCLSALGLLSTGSLVGVAASLYLVNRHPLLLVALSPIGRHLILVAPIVDPVAFVGVAVTRRMLFYLACFHLGRALGPAGIVWIEARAARAARFVRWLERLFDRWSRGVVFLMPGPTVSGLAGTSGMTTRLFVAISLLGLVFRMLLVLAFAEWLRSPIEDLLALIDEYRIPGTVVIVAGIAVHQWRRRRSPTRGS